MNTIFDLVAAQIWKYLEPKLEEKLQEFIKTAFEKWMPTVVKSVVVAVSQSAGQLVVDSADKVTDIIPGKVDDVIVDTLVERTREALAQWGIKF